MTNISYNLSGRIDQVLVDVLRIVHQEASSQDMLFFVVGATARDILLNHCHAIRSNRATRDLDIGVEVAGWDEFRQLSEALIATGKFTPTKETYRLNYMRFPVDIVPFGGVSKDNRTISWPPDHQVIMNIMGFQEAYDYGVTVRLDENPLLDVKVPTIPGMAMMKIISWNDRYPERPKDAEDLLFLMEHYAEAGNLDRLYDDEVELLHSRQRGSIKRWRASGYWDKIWRPWPQPQPVWQSKQFWIPRQGNSSAIAWCRTWHEAHWCTTGLTNCSSR